MASTFPVSKRRRHSGNATVNKYESLEHTLEHYEHGATHAAVRPSQKAGFVIARQYLQLQMSRTLAFEATRATVIELNVSRRVRAVVRLSRWWTRRLTAPYWSTAG